MYTGVLALLIPLTAVVGGIMLAALKIWKGSASQQSQKLSEEETRFVQELYRDLEKMEERVQALETILLDRQRRENTK